MSDEAPAPTNPELSGEDFLYYEVQGVIARVRQEADLTYAQMVGVLESIKFELLQETYGDWEEWEDEGEGWRDEE